MPQGQALLDRPQLPWNQWEPSYSHPATGMVHVDQIASHHGPVLMEHKLADSRVHPMYCLKGLVPREKPLMSQAH